MTTLNNYLPDFIAKEIERLTKIQNDVKSMVLENVKNHMKKMDEYRTIMIVANDRAILIDKLVKPIIE